MENLPEAAPEAGVSSQKYVVGKNDTLQKISKKFYGTTRHWTKIYEANRDVLKGPDKVYPGQTLNIPEAGEMKPASETLSEPKENLK
jgi:nucleoid-associated protein YgaU